MFPLEQPLLLLLPIHIQLYLLENTVQEGKETWESIFLPLVRKQNTSLLLIFSFLSFKKIYILKKNPISLERSQLLGESFLWIHTSGCLSLCCWPSQSVIGMCCFQCQAILGKASSAGSWDTTQLSILGTPQPTSQPLCCCR